MGLTLAQVAERSGIGSSTISDFENGKREPRFRQLNELANAYHRPVSFFLDESAPEIETVLWREKPESQTAKELQARLLELAEQYRHIEVLCDETRSYNLPRADDVDCDAFSYADATELARRVRNGLELGSRPGQTLLRVLEEVCHIKIFHLAFEPTGSAACTVSPRSGAAILLNSSNARWRRNFDLAHELFHILTWKTFRDSGGEDGVVSSEREEKLATCFARNLLMPREPLQWAVDTERGDSHKLSSHAVLEIARQFDVSIDALLWQIAFVYNRDSDSESIRSRIAQIRKQIGKRSDQSPETPPERPPRFLALARWAFRKGLIGTGRYAEYAGISRHEAMRIMEQDAEEDVEIEVAHS